MHPVGVSPAEGTISKNAVIYEATDDEPDRTVVLRPGRFEELRVVRSPQGVISIPYELTLAPDAQVRATRGVLEVSTTSGILARTLPAFAIDARGKRRALTLELTNLAGVTTVTWSLDGRDLEYPVIVDPTWVFGAPSSWPSEAVVALNSAWLVASGSIDGDVAVVDAAPGAVLADDAELVVGALSDVTGNVRANRVRVRVTGNVSGNVSTNALTNLGHVGGSVVSPLGLPLPITVPAMPSVTPGSTAVTLITKQDLALASGNYAGVTLNAGTPLDATTLTLSGGNYSFSSLTLGAWSRVECAAACRIGIAGRLDAATKCSIGPSTDSSITSETLRSSFLA